MSWRQFQVFIRCLSDQAATVVRLSSSQYIGAHGRVNTVVGPKAAEAAFQAAFAK